MDSLIETYRAYVDDPHRFWSGASLRQADKLEQKKRSISARTGWPLHEVADRTLDLARSRSSPHAVYVTGLGGSGSHWLAGMLGDLPGFFDAGEVYFPPRLTESLDANPESASAVVDALHVIHARSEVTESARPVNCAAGAAWTGRYLTWDPQAAVVYLIRDPRDQVLSTTFRKGEYRSYLDVQDDYEYLRHRCELSRSDRSAYVGGGIAADVTVRYEDLRLAPVAAIERILEAVGTEVDPQLVRSVAEDYDAELIREGRSDRVGNLNLDHGLRSWQRESPRWTTAIHAELATVIEDLGYPLGRCLVDPIRDASMTQAPEAPPPGIRLRGWSGNEWACTVDSGPWLAEIVEIAEGQVEWLSTSSLQAVCATRLSQITDIWLQSVLENPALKALDLGGVSITESQLELLLAQGSRLMALGLWRSAEDSLVERIRRGLPAATVFA